MGTVELTKLPQRAVKNVRWTKEPEMQAFMVEHSNLDNLELSMLFNERFGFHLSRPQITLWRQMNGQLKRESRHQGGRPQQPIGAEYVAKSGYIMVKFREKPIRPGSKDNWMLKHQWIYTQNHGYIPKDHIIFFCRWE